MTRISNVERDTNETRVKMELRLDGVGERNIYTEIGFLDHMLDQVGKHGFMDIFLNVQGDIDVDSHHTIEDIGIVFGKALAEALGSKEGVNRYGHAIIPMEDALILCAIDLSGRPYLEFDATFTTPRIGTLDTEMIEEFFRAFCLHAGVNMHIKQLAGKNNHHVAEAIFKAFARALRQAVKKDANIEGVMSTKGMLE